MLRAPLPAQNALTKPYEFCPRMARLSTELRCRQVPILTAKPARTRCNCLRIPGREVALEAALGLPFGAYRTRRLMPFGRQLVESTG